MRGGLQEISPVLEARIGYCHGIGEPCFVVKGLNYSTYRIELDIKKLLLSILEHRLGSSARKPRPSTTSKTAKPPLSYTGRPEVSPQGKAFHDMTQRDDMPGGQAGVESRASHVPRTSCELFCARPPGGPWGSYLGTPWGYSTAGRGRRGQFVLSRNITIRGVPPPVANTFWGLVDRGRREGAKRSPVYFLRCPALASLPKTNLLFSHFTLLLHSLCPRLGSWIGSGYNGDRWIRCSVSVGATGFRVYNLWPGSYAGSN